MENWTLPMGIGYNVYYNNASYFENNPSGQFAITNVPQNNFAQVMPVEPLRAIDFAPLYTSNTGYSAEISRYEAHPNHFQSAYCGQPHPPATTNSSIHNPPNLREYDTENVTGAFQSQEIIGNNDTRMNYISDNSGYNIASLYGVPVRIKTTNNLGSNVPRSAKRQTPKRFLLTSRNSTANVDFEKLEEMFEIIEKVLSQGQITYVCPLCPSEHTTKPNVQEHMKLHLAKRTFDCHLCPRQFKLDKNLQKHIFWHTKTPLECHLCHKKLTSVAGYKTHMESHSGITYECTICNRELLTIGSFEGHMKTHIENKVYECSVCGKKLKYKLTLNAHMRLHTGEKPYECNICHMRMATSQILRNHMKRHR